MLIYYRVHSETVNHLYKSAARKRFLKAYYFWVLSRSKRNLKNQLHRKRRSRVSYTLLKVQNQIKYYYLWGFSFDQFSLLCCFPITFWISRFQFVFWFLKIWVLSMRLKNYVNEKIIQVLLTWITLYLLAGQHTLSMPKYPLYI